MTNSTETPKNIRLLNPGPLDAWYGPYNSLSDAYAAIPNTAIDGVNFRESKVVGIRTPEGIIDYYWPILYTNAGLVPKAKFNTIPGKNKYDYTKDILGSYIDTVDGVLRQNISYNASSKILAKPLSSYVISGMGNIHYGLGISFYNASNALISHITTAQDATSFSFTSPASTQFLQFTTKTGKPGDNMVASNIQLEIGSVPTVKEAYSEEVVKINDRAIVATSVIKDASNYYDALGKGQADALYIGKTEFPIINTEVVLSKNLFDYTKSVYGYIDPVSGDLVLGGSTYVVSPPINIISLTPYTISGLGDLHYGLGIAYYNVSGVKIGNGIITQQDVKTGTVTSIANAATCRFTVKTSKPGDNIDISNIQFEQGSVATTKVDFQSITLAVMGGNKAVSCLYNALSFGPVNQAKSVVTKEYLEANAITASPDNISAAIGKNLFDLLAVISGFYIDVSTGNTMSNANYSISEKIRVNAGVAYTLSGLGSIHHGLGVAYYNAASVKIGYGIISQQDVDKGTITTPTLTNYMQFTVKTGKPGDNTVLNNVQLEYGSQATAKENVIKVNFKNIPSYSISYLYSAICLGNLDNPLSPATRQYVDSKSQPVVTFGKKMLILGDSITEQIVEGGSVPVNISWVNYATPILGVIVSNYAKSGASWADYGPNNEGQKLSVQVQRAIDAAEIPDIIIISIGTNDYARPTGLSDYATAMGKATLADLDRLKLYEAMRYNLWKIKTQWPNAKCYYQMPIQRADRDIDSVLWFDAAARKMCNRYNFTLIQATVQSGIIRDFEINGSEGRFLKDGLHPNDAGKQLLGKYNASVILNTYL